MCLVLLCIPKAIEFLHTEYIYSKVEYYDLFVFNIYFQELINTIDLK